MQHTEGKFNASDGLELYHQAWRPDGETKAVLAVVHGYGEHSGRYLNPVNYFVPRGYALYTYDLRGHGKSAGQRGHINHFEEYLSDTDIFLTLVREQQPGRKVFLLGHSLGGLIVAAYAENHPGELPGLIMSSAFLSFKMQVPGWKAMVGRVMSALNPTMTMKNDLSASLLSHDLAVVAAYDTDPQPPRGDGALVHRNHRRANTDARPGRRSDNPGAGALCRRGSDCRPRGQRPVL